MKYLLLVLLTLTAFAAPENDFKDRHYLLEVNRGNVPGHSIVHKFGSNDSVGTSYVPITSAGVYQTPTGLVSLEIVSSSANDAAAGSGARTVTITGINDTNGSWTEDTETVTMNGTSAVALTKQWRRVYRLRVATSGTYGSASGSSHNSTITLRVAGAGATWGTIVSDGGFGFGSSEIAGFTIPKGKRGIILHKDVFVDASKPADILFFVRDQADMTTAPYGTMRVLEVERAVESPLAIDVPAGQSLIEGPADVGFMAKLPSGTGYVGADFDILLIEH